METQLDWIDIPFDCLLHGNHLCSNDNHKYELEIYYEKIMSAIMFADAYLPRNFSIHQKSFWNQELSRLKQLSIDCYRIWHQNNSPSSGLLFDKKKEAH